MKTTRETWTCVGEVRGSCGIAHKTLDSAVTCCEEDQAGCASQGGYSDRGPVSSVSGEAIVCGGNCDHEECY